MIYNMVYSSIVIRKIFYLVTFIMFFLFLSYLWFEWVQQIRQVYTLCWFYNHPYSRFRWSIVRRQTISVNWKCSEHFYEKDSLKKAIYLYARKFWVKFYNYFWMFIQNFDELLDIVKKRTTKRRYNIIGGTINYYSKARLGINQLIS